MKHLLLLVLWLALIPLQLIHAQEAESPKEKIIHELTSKAENGDAAAQCELGDLYLNKGQYDGWGRGKWGVRKRTKAIELGVSFPRDPVEALKWNQKAAAQDNPRGLFQLASMYASGEGVPTNLVEALNLYRKAAAKGFVPAQREIGTMFLLGNGVATDPAEAEKWYRMAAERGDNDSQIHLWLAATDKGDKEEAKKWEAIVLHGDPLNKVANSPSEGTQAQLGEPPNNAPHEMAAEQLYRVLAQYWVGNDWKYVTQFITKSDDGAGSETPNEAFLQIDSIVLKFTRETLSRADKLNKITYRGAATMGFGTYRLYRQADDAWGDWQSTVQYYNSFFETLLKPFAPNAPPELKRRTDLSFDITQRDGMWIIVTESGDRFENGRRASLTKEPLSKAPSPEVVKVLQDGGSFKQRQDLLKDQSYGTLQARQKLMADTIQQMKKRTLTP